MTFLLFGLFLIACLSAGSTGGLFPPGAWYRALKKPVWTPPDWVFPVTWILLYLCMASAATRAALVPGSGLALAIWSVQIALNTLWSPVFFGLKRIKAGMAVLVGLWITVAATMLAFWQLDTVAGLLFAPYLLWVTIAGALNAEVWRLNPEEANAPRPKIT